MKILYFCNDEFCFNLYYVAGILMKSWAETEQKKSSAKMPSSET